MKKTIATVLALLLALSLAACGSQNTPDEQMITRPPQEQTEAPAQTPESQPAAETQAVAQAPQPAAQTDYTFVADGVELVPGDPFDPGVLPQAQSVYEVPSCAIEGTDNVYNYGTFELTAFDDGTQELIYSIYLIDANITTPEGLALGDSLEKMTELYGDDYVQEVSGYSYIGATSRLEIIATGDFVEGITYYMIVE